MQKIARAQSKPGWPSHITVLICVDGSCNYMCVFMSASQHSEHVAVLPLCAAWVDAAGGC